MNLTQKIILGLCFILVPVSGFSQIKVRDEQTFHSKEKVTIHHMYDLGFGFGIDYGGFLGAKFEVSPFDRLGIFVSGGYYLIGFGWQAGVLGYIIPKTTEKTFRLAGKFMYGTNSVIMVVNEQGGSTIVGDEYNKIYTGATIGLVGQLRFGTYKKNGFDVELNYLFRDSGFYDDYNRMKNDPRLTDVTEPLPVSFSIGYHHEF
jgi:hypothetical protein